MFFSQIKWANYNHGVSGVVEGSSGPLAKSPSFQPRSLRLSEAEALAPSPTRHTWGRHPSLGANRTGLPAPQGLVRLEKACAFPQEAAGALGRALGAPLGAPPPRRSRPRGQGRTSRPLCSRGGFLTQPFQPARGLLCGPFPLASGRGFAGWTDCCPGRPHPARFGRGRSCAAGVRLSPGARTKPPPSATLPLVRNGRRGFRLPSANPRRDAAGPWSHPLRSDSPFHLPKEAASSAWISRCRCMTC